jgi:hypothetical protein
VARPWDRLDCADDNVENNEERDKGDFSDSHDIFDPSICFYWKKVHKAVEKEKQKAPHSRAHTLGGSPTQGFVWITDLSEVVF